MDLTRSRLDQLLNDFTRLRIGVLGDFTLDGYWTVDMQRATLSRETPLFNRPVVAERYSPGGAANVAWNVAALGVGEVWTFSALGDDWRGQILLRLLLDLGIEENGLIQTADWQTPFFGKVLLSGYHSQQEDARLDFVNSRPLSYVAESALVERIDTALPGLDALIIADYQVNGVVTPRLVQALNQLVVSHPQILFLVDSRENLGQFHGMAVKPNEIEAARLLFPGRDLSSLTETDYQQAVQRLAEQTGRSAYLTMGAQGCLIYDLAEGGLFQIPAVDVPPPIDPVGAGDTFLASLAAALAAGAFPQEAAQLATLSAAVTIRKLGITGAATPQEIRTIAELTPDPSLLRREGEG